MKYLYIILGLAFIATFFFKVIYGSPEAKGRRGEAWVAGYLAELPEERYYILNDLMVPGKYGTVQIDHVVVSRYGIIVIETKNYTGWIYGGENYHTWTQNIYGEKNAFRNPLQQNMGHIAAIRNLLDVPRNAYISIVAFAEKADLKVRTEQNLIYMSEICDTILGYTDVLLSDQQVEYAVKMLKAQNIIDPEKRAEHTDHVRNAIMRHDSKIMNGICPRCGGELKVRSGRYGEFIGCSNYPDCTFTDNLN